MPLPVQTIACVNDAAFVMSFGLEILDMNTGIPLILENVDTGNYPIDQTRSIDLSTTGIAEGTWVRPQVRAVWGDTNLGNRYVQYAQNGQTASYDVSGTTLNYSVNLITAS
ncbi:MAG TPA: hypothetical protein VFA41_05010 [Ktedonobacteraceae bacterium]|nr:hypothetical protein [Ktedonobacteraceae bacterium]